MLALLFALCTWAMYGFGKMCLPRFYALRHIRLMFLGVAVLFAAGGLIAVVVGLFCAVTGIEFETTS